MKYFTLFSLLTLTAADQVAELTGLYNDLKAHGSDYLGLVQQGKSIPPELITLYQEVQTYTNQDYTTLVSQINMGEIESFVPELPWYSSRLATYFQAAATGASSSAASSSTAPSSAASSSAASSSAAESSATSAASSIVSSASQESSSSSASSSTAAVSSETGNNANQVAAELFIPMAMMAAFPFLL